MDQSRVPVLEALEEFRRRGDVAYGQPGHKQGRGVDPRVLDVLGTGVFTSDVLTLNGLDDRRGVISLASRGEKLLVPRNAHTSVIAGMLIPDAADAAMTSLR